MCFSGYLTIRRVVKVLTEHGDDNQIEGRVGELLEICTEFGKRIFSCRSGTRTRT